MSGCSPNQTPFYPRFDRVVLLTAPIDVILQRLATRSSNDFGKDPGEVVRSRSLT